MSILSLKEAALAAYKEQQEVDAERLAERTASIGRVARQRFMDAFRIEPDSVETAGKITLVSAGGLVLRYSGEGSFYMWGTCPRCLQLDTGQYVDSLELLGKALVEGFTPSHTHHCRADYEPPEPEPAPDPMLTAVLAVVAELRRLNDRNDTRGNSSPIGPHPEPATDDPFMPPDAVWEWLPQAQCTVVDGDGRMYWYSGGVEMGEDEWYPTTTDPMGRLGSRDLGGTDWRTTKRTRPAHL